MEMETSVKENKVVVCNFFKTSCKGKDLQLNTSCKFATEKMTEEEKRYILM